MEENNSSKEQSEPECTESVDLHDFDCNLGLVTQQEYEAQFFGFTPKSFSDGLYNATVEYLHDGLMSVAKVLKAEFKNNKQSEEKLAEAAEKVFNHIQPFIGKKFDKLELYVAKNIFKIPPNVLLPEDQVWRDYPSATQADVRQAQTEIQALKDKLIMLKHVGSCLRQELCETRTLVAELRHQIDLQKSQLAACHDVIDEIEPLHCRELGVGKV